MAYMGIESFAGFRDAPWTSLGDNNVTVKDEISIRELADRANLLGWNLRLEPTPAIGRTHIENFDVVRTNPTDGIPDTIGRVGSRYSIINNEELVEFVEAVTHGEYVAETASSFNYGATVFMSVRLNEMMIGDDPINQYLLISTSHDGSKNMQASMVPLRVWCANALNIHKNAQRTYKVRHTRNAETRIAEARKALGMAELYFDQFSIMANEMISQEINDTKFEEIVLTAYPRPEENVKGAQTRHENKVSELFSIYRGKTVENIHGTAWGAFNAMEEQLDWYRKSRTGNDDNIFAAASGFLDSMNREKNRLFDITRALV